MELFPFGTAFETDEAPPVYNFLIPPVGPPSGTAPSFTAGPTDGQVYQVGVHDVGTSTATGDPPPFIYTADQPPPGLSVVFGSGRIDISGTPQPGTEGDYIMNLVATNGVTPDATQQFLITINP